MRRPRLVVGSILMTLALLAPGTEAAKKLRVVATIPDLKSLTEAVGGDLVEVDALTRGTQNFHEAEVRPSMMLKLRRADALIENGVELDAWADVAVLGANNPNIVRGAAGRIEISRGISLLEVPSTRVDRSMGDVHPLGNPHFSLPGARTHHHAEYRGRARSPLARRPPGAREQQAGLPREARPGDGALEQDHGARPWRQGDRLPPRRHLLSHPLRPRPGRHARGPTRHSAVAPAPRPDHSPDKGRRR